MKAPAALALIVYAAGIPLAFFILLVRNRAAIKEDQILKLQGLGNSSASACSLSLSLAPSSVYLSHSPILPLSLFLLRAHTLSPPPLSLSRALSHSLSRFLLLLHSLT
jgi:hypothetical protein